MHFYPSINISLLSVSITPLIIFYFPIEVSVMATKFTPVSEVRCGNTSFNLKARVIHLWSVPDKINPAEEGTIHMLLLDEKVCISIGFFCCRDLCYLLFIHL